MGGCESEGEWESEGSVLRDLAHDVGLGKRNLQRGLPAVNAPPAETAEGRQATTFVAKHVLRAMSFAIKTERVDLHGRYVAHVFHSTRDMTFGECFLHGHYLDAQLLAAGHARRFDVIPPPGDVWNFFWPSTSLYRKRSAARAWFCVDALTCCSVAREDRNAVTSFGPSVLGWRRLVALMNRRTHRQYASIVRGLACFVSSRVSKAARTSRGVVSGGAVVDFASLTPSRSQDVCRLRFRRFLRRN